MSPTCCIALVALNNIAYTPMQELRMRVVLMDGRTDGKKAKRTNEAAKNIAKRKS